MIVISLGILILGTYFIIEKKNKIPEHQWAHSNNGDIIREQEGRKGVSLNINAIWDITKGDPSVVIGMLDTGINTELNSINESIDDRGRNFYSNDEVLYKNYTSDYHGTMLASIITGEHTKENPVWGVAPKVKLMPLKFMEGREGSLKKAVEAIHYASENNIKIINCSWDTEIYNDELYNIIKQNKDILFVSSAGKHSNDLTKIPVYPSSYDLSNVVSVGAIENNGEISKLSGFGQQDMIYAPGGNIKVLDPKNNVNYVDGSSYATAYVTGVVTLIKSIKPDITAQEIKKLLLKINNINGWIDTRDIIKELKLEEL